MKQSYFFQILIFFTFFISLFAEETTQEYHSDFIDLVEMIYGEGILSQGGIESVDELFFGIDLNGLKILDLGSGLGMFDIHLAKKNQVDIVGLEPQNELVEKANQYLEKQKHELTGHVSFQIMEDQANLNQFRSESFDIVFSKEAILHVPYAVKQNYFHEIYRVLKPGGKIIIMDWMHTSHSYSEQTRKMMEMDGIAYQLLTPGQYQNIIETAGFAEIDLIDLTELAAKHSEQNLATIQSLEEVIKLKFGVETYEYCLESWGYQKEAFQKRELLAGVFKAVKANLEK